MKSKSISLILLVFGLLFVSLSVAGAGELPPSGSKPLSVILKSVEEQKLGSITEAEIDDGMWEVTACDVKACHKLYIDLKFGEEKRRRETGSEDTPLANAMPLSTIIQSIEARGLGIITDVELDDGFWEVELHKDGRKSELTIDPKTGETKS